MPARTITISPSRRPSPRLSADSKTLTVRVPLKIVDKGGRKLVITPTGADSWQPQSHPPVSALTKAIARAFRWRKLLETGVYASIGEMAAAEKINPSYLSRVLRLTLLAPEIVEALFAGKHTSEVKVGDLLGAFPMVWTKQTTWYFHFAF